MTMTTTQMQYRVRGTTDDVTTCGFCGREDLKKTVVLRVLDIDGNEVEQVYAGVDCAAALARRTQKAIRQEITAAEKANREAEAAARQKRHDADNAAFMAWVADTYGVAADQPGHLHGKIPGMTPFKLRKEYQQVTGRH